MIIHESNLVKLEFNESIKAAIWTPKAFMEGNDWKEPFAKGVNFFENKIKHIKNMRML